MSFLKSSRFSFSSSISGRVSSFFGETSIFSVSINSSKAVLSRELSAFLPSYKPFLKFSTSSVASWLPSNLSPTSFLLTLSISSSNKSSAPSSTSFTEVYLSFSRRLPSASSSLTCSSGVSFSWVLLSLSRISSKIPSNFSFFLVYRGLSFSILSLLLSSVLKFSSNSLRASLFLVTLSSLTGVSSLACPLNELATSSFNSLLSLPSTTLSPRASILWSCFSLLVLTAASVGWVLLGGFASKISTSRISDFSTPSFFNASPKSATFTAGSTSSFSSYAVISISSNSGVAFCSLSSSINSISNSSSVFSITFSSIFSSLNWDFFLSDFFSSSNSSSKSSNTASNSSWSISSSLTLNNLSFSLEKNPTFFSFSSS